MHSEHATSLRNGVKNISDHAKAEISETARAAAHSVQDTTAQQVQHTADAAEAAAASFHPNSAPAEVLGQVADQIGSIADQVRGADFNELSARVTDYARQNPAVFIGGAALLGFAVTRFLKARPQEVGLAHDPWVNRATAQGEAGNG